MTNLRELTAKLTPEELRFFLREAPIILDSMGQELIAKAAGPHSPIAIGELDSFKNGTRDQRLLRLHKLQTIGIFGSSFEAKDGKTERVFAVTELGRKFNLSS